MNAFSKKISIPTTLQKHLLADLPPTHPPLQENIRLRDITKCTRNKDKQVQKAKPVGTCFPEWKILVFAQEMRGVGRGDSLGRGTLVHSVTEKKTQSVLKIIESIFVHLHIVSNIPTKFYENLYRA